MIGHHAFVCIIRVFMYMPQSALILLINSYLSLAMDGKDYHQRHKGFIDHSLNTITC